MNYKSNTWEYVDVSYLKTFGQQVPVYSPSVYREFRGEIFTTYHSETHPVNELLPNDSVVHGRFSKSYRNVLRGLHYDDKTYKLVQALVGEIYLVVLDVRQNSDTYGKWESFCVSPLYMLSNYWYRRGSERRRAFLFSISEGLLRR